ncbi:TPA: c-type cytochrome [Photobacterium damselae]
MRFYLSIFIPLCFFFSNVVIADIDQGQFTVGQQKAAVCMTCHGADGISTIDTYPNLKNQKIQYMVAALKAYQEKQRTGGLAILMHAQADALSEQDMLDISYYFHYAK